MPVPLKFNTGTCSDRSTLQDLRASSNRTKSRDGALRTGGHHECTIGDTGLPPETSGAGGTINNSVYLRIGEFKSLKDGTLNYSGTEFQIGQRAWSRRHECKDGRPTPSGGGSLLCRLSQFLD